MLDTTAMPQSADPASLRRRSLPRGLFAGGVVVVICATAAWWWLRAPKVEAIALQVAPLVRTLQLSARVVTASRVELGSTLTGRVLPVAVPREPVLREAEQ